MKNLKRVLSLALTGTMLAGMLTIGASAANKDFTDADEITHVEAVNVMSTLGVLKGKDTGAFDPTATVTRAEMAKIITVMLNGGNDPTLGSGSNAMFSDIQNHWAKNYIEYCASMGIIAGQGDGTFAPDAPVTGGAAAKMLLVAMGYDSSIFNFTGIDWEINVNRQANEAKLYEGIANIDTSKGLSRDNTAQMAYNALEAKIMVTTYDKVISSGEISWNYALSNQTFLNKYFGASTFIGSFDGNYNTEAAPVKGQIKVTGFLDNETRIDNSGNALAGKPAYLPSDLDISFIGEEVKVIFKDAKTGVTNRPDKNDTIYGVFVTGRTEVVNSTLGKVGSQKSDKSQIVIDDTKYDTTDKVKVIYNYAVKTYATNDLAANNGVNDDPATKADEGKNSTLTTTLLKTNGDTLKAIINPESGKIDTIYVTSYKIGAITAKNSSKVTISATGIGSIDLDKTEIYEDAAKGDIVVVSQLYNTDVDADNTHFVVEKAEKISGVVKRYKITQGKDDDNNTIYTYNNVNLDGTTYTINNTSLLLTNGIEDDGVISYFGDPNLDQDFDLYLINGYVGAAIQTSESASNYSVVTAVKTGTSGAVFAGLQLQVMDGEGHKSIITVNKDSVNEDASKDGNGKYPAAVTAANYTVGDIVVWSGSTDDAKVVIKKKATTGTLAYNATTKSVGGYVAAPNCVLFAEIEDDVDIESSTKEYGNATFKAYDIRSLRNTGVTSKVCSFVKDSNDKVVAVFMDLDNRPGGATDTTVYGIVTGWAGRGTASDGSPYDIYTVVSNEETYNINIDSQVTIKKGNLLSFEPTTDEIYDDSNVQVWEDGTVEGLVASGAVYAWSHNASDKTLTFYKEVQKNSAGNYVGKGSTATYAIDDDCQIIYVDANGDKVGAVGAGIDRFDSVTGLSNVGIVFESRTDGKFIIAIFVETSNKVDVMKKD